MKRTLRAAFGGALLCASVLNPAPEAMAKAPDHLTQAINEILKREVFGPATVAIDIRDLETGRVVFERNATLNVKPASTMKLFTTAALLDAEGQGTVPAPTSVETAGRLDAFGRVLGDVYLIGRGDPNLSDRSEWRGGKGPFDQLANDIHDAGITRIEGRLIGYDGLFTDQAIPENWTADDLLWSYGATVSSLTAFDGALRLRLGPGEREGEPTLLTVEPLTAFIDVENRTRTSAEGSRASISLSRALGSRHVIIEGTLPRLGAAWTGAVAAPEPSLFATTLFAEALARRGVIVRDGARISRDPLPESLRPLASVRGPEVAEQIRIVNKESQNLHAEVLLRRLGLGVFKDASVEASLRGLALFLKRLGVRSEGTAMYDGSGLSRSALVTARAEVDLLVAMATHPLAKAFKDSLPIGGTDGTLKRRMKGTEAEGRVFAKTGSIAHVNALAGYVDSTSGRHLAFSIIVNHHTRPSKEATDAMDAICSLLAGLR
ncbi:MAG: D-alanyl-D-alanine carboxypeptidase/D-alanyl-D-alanine-endopeptidase [Vicinamibacteria bacterium]|nr:D-alanyl-D-alanine carboxypeptidase/D-alanyl-D-alanine-endopeptidase [Vicinamibacteria bacterium]